MPAAALASRVHAATSVRCRAAVAHSVRPRHSAPAQTPSEAQRQRGLAVALPEPMLTILLVVLLVVFLVGGGVGYSRWGAGGMSPAVIIGIVLLLLLATNRL